MNALAIDRMLTDASRDALAGRPPKLKTITVYMQMYRYSASHLEEIEHRRQNNLIRLVARKPQDGG